MEYSQEPEENKDEILTIEECSQLLKVNP